MKAARWLLCSSLLGLGPGLAGCGGGSPLLHPAHALTEGSVSFGAGSSGRFVLGGAADAQTRAKALGSESGGALTDEARAEFVRGGLSRLALAPGLSPFFSGRVGLGNHNEAGLAYTGRSGRLDARHTFETRAYALSVGAAVSGMLSRSGDAPAKDVSETSGGLRATSLTSSRGYGAEVPILIGYRSDGDVVVAWAGLRAGVEQGHYQISLSIVPDEAVRSRVDATRLWGGGLVGFAVGLSPIQIALELDLAYESASGSLQTGSGEVSAEVAGLTLSPAAAISAKF